MDISTINVVAYLGITITIACAIYRYAYKRYKFEPGNFFIVIFFSFGAAGGFVFLAGCISLLFFNKFILDFDLSSFLIPALIGSLGGTPVLIYYLWGFLDKSSDE